MTVLVLAPERDLSADRMVKTLERRDVPVARFDTAWFPRHASIDSELHGGRWTGTLHGDGRLPHDLTFDTEARGRTDRNGQLSRPARAHGARSA